MPFLDELGSGVAPVATPDIAAELALDPGTMAGVMIAAFGGLALFVEAPLLAWSERFPVRRVSSVALVVLAAALALAALAPDAWCFLAALALYGPASGCALAMAEGTLVESRPSERERTMARLALAGEAGDLAVPILLGALAVLGLGWRTGVACAAALALAIAIVHARSAALDAASRHDEEDEDEREPTLREAARTALAAKPLLGWSLLGSLTNLLDEVLVAFTAVHLALDLGAGPIARATAIGAWTIGGIGGVAALERWLHRVDSGRVLRLASAVTALAIGLLVITPDVAVAIAALAVIGASSSMLHPLIRARAYASLPGRPAIVNAVASALAPIDVAAPLLLAWIAATWGPAIALCALLVAPLAIGAGTLAPGRARASSEPGAP